jgi:hypothetical protein
MIWVIEYLGMPPCWIEDRSRKSAAFDVTFQRSLAKRFTSQEDANHEILRLGLSSQWAAQQIGAGAAIKTWLAPKFGAVK